MELAQVVAVHHIDGRILGGLQQQMRVRPRLVGQQKRTAGTDVRIGFADAVLIVRG